MVGSDASMSLVLLGADLDSMASCYSGFFDISILHHHLTKKDSGCLCSDLLQPLSKIRKLPLLAGRAYNRSSVCIDSHKSVANDTHH
jgi:hypothetical protein